MIDSIVFRTCGRPTRSGQPCKARLYGADVACGQHKTPEERASAEAYQRGWREGYDRGQESARSGDELRVQYLERRIKDLEQQLDDARRYYVVDGDQVVEVNDRYAYRWDGSPKLAVGDRVIIPENWLSRAKDGPGGQEAIVTKLGATYRGGLSSIIRRLD